MATDNPDTDQSGKSGGAQSKKGVPRHSLVEVVDWARTLWADARFGTTPHDAFAVSLGHTKASGGSWRTKMAAIRAYDLVREIEGEPPEIGLNELGLSIVRDDDEGIRDRARTEAYMRVDAFSEMVRDSSGEHLPTKESLASKFEFRWGLKKEAAVEAAQNLIESAKFAGVVQEDGEDLLVAIPSDDEESSAADEDSSGSGSHEEPQEPTTEDRASKHSAHGDANGLAEVTRPVTLEVTLDLSQFAVEEILRLLAALDFIDDDGQSTHS